MDYHNVSCQTLTPQYFKDTLRYVKLFGALKSILKGCGMVVPESKAGGWRWRCCPAVESGPGPSATDRNGGDARSAPRAKWDPPPPMETRAMPAPPREQLPVTQPAGPRSAPCWDTSRGTAGPRGDTWVTLPAVRGWGQTGTRRAGKDPGDRTRRGGDCWRGERNPEPSAGRSLALPLMKPRSGIQREAISDGGVRGVGCGCWVQVWGAGCGCGVWGAVPAASSQRTVAFLQATRLSPCAGGSTAPSGVSSPALHLERH